MGPLAYPAFVDEDDRASFLLGFFFNGRPLHPPPMADGFLIALTRPSYRALATPAQIIQDLPYMAGLPVLFGNSIGEHLATAPAGVSIRHTQPARG